MFKKSNSAPDGGFPSGSGEFGERIYGLEEEFAPLTESANHRLRGKRNQEVFSRYSFLLHGSGGHAIFQGAHACCNVRR